MKIIGYILAVIGLIAIAISSFKPARTFIEGIIKLPAMLTDTYLLIGGGIVFIIGIFLSMKGGSGKGKQVPEVPIYHGKNVVGYRRVK